MEEVEDSGRRDAGCGNLRSLSTGIKWLALHMLGPTSAGSSTSYSEGNTSSDTASLSAAKAPRGKRTGLLHRSTPHVNSLPAHSGGDEGGLSAEARS